MNAKKSEKLREMEREILYANPAEAAKLATKIARLKFGDRGRAQRQ